MPGTSHRGKELWGGLIEVGRQRALRLGHAETEMLAGCQVGS